MTVGHTTGVAVGHVQGGHVLLLDVVAGFGLAVAGFGPAVAGFGPAVAGFGPAVAGFGPAVAGFGLLVAKILISAQLTNVSGSFPCQLFPVVHHHCSTQWSHEKPVGSLRVMVYSPAPVSPRVHSWLPFSSSNMVLSRSACVIGGLTSRATRNIKYPL